MGAELRIERREEDISGLTLGLDGLRNISNCEVLNGMIKFNNPDWSIEYNFLGAETVGGIHITGEEIYYALIRLFIRNHFDLSWLEDVMIDGGSNFKGSIKGLIGWLNKHPGVKKITFRWCPIHRL
jgi:hypothetical protein